MTHTSYNSTKSMLIIGSIVTLSMIAMVNPAAAYHSSNDIDVTSSNSASVLNAVVVGANTGGNAVVGGNTGMAGNGGDATSHSWSKWNHHHNKGVANAGNGGNTGSTNNEAVVVTGDSLADGLVVNVVNSNVTRIAR